MSTRNGYSPSVNQISSSQARRRRRRSSRASSVPGMDDWQSCWRGTPVRQAYSDDAGSKRKEQETAKSNCAISNTHPNNSPNNNKTRARYSTGLIRNTETGSQYERTTERVPLALRVSHNRVESCRAWGAYGCLRQQQI